MKNFVEIVKELGFDERGGGPEGIYYSSKDGTFNLTESEMWMLVDVLKKFNFESKKKGL